jgi:two-component system chemotaxis response regulator CheY
VRTLNEARILVVGWKPNSNEFLRSVLSALGRPAFTRVSNTDDGVSILREHGFELLLCTDDPEPDSAAAFTRAVRRDQYGRQPTIPIVIISKGATLKDIDALRAAGIDDIMCPPMSAEAVQKRLDRLLLQSRNFVACKAFVGPERRRTPDRSFDGSDRRSEPVGLYRLPPILRRENIEPSCDAAAGKPAQTFFICDT